ncbi:MAG: FAD-dependent oxidoreductase, partial [Planctomycetota bacterium]
LCCALRLREAGREVLVVDRADRVGGRVVTDEVDGFRIDRGFQVLLTSYPEVKARLDLDALELQAFRSGSAVRLRDRTCVVADPFREPFTALRALFSPLLSLRDAARSFWLRRRLLGSGPHRGRARDVLRDAGLRGPVLDAFFRPFFQGVTLDPDLGVPADYFAFLFRMFAAGEATLPREGMGAIGRQLAGRLPAASLRLGVAVSAVGRDHVTLADGARLDAAAVVVATDGAAAAGLVAVPAPAGHRATPCVSFAVSGAPPIAARMLLLNGTGRGATLHVCVPSVVQPSYAPAGAHLVSATALGAHGPQVADDVRADLRSWFGPQVDAWDHLQTTVVARALPALDTEEAVMHRSGAARLASGVVVCGDHLATPSIQGAMAAGRSAAELALAEPLSG